MTTPASHPLSGCAWAFDFRSPSPELELQPQFEQKTEPEAKPETKNIRDDASIIRWSDTDIAFHHFWAR
jgi:hypothetical protein